MKPPCPKEVNGHFKFINFPQYGLFKNPVYFAVVRDIIPKMISNFYYLRR